MPSSMHRRTNAVLDSIYSDYSDYDTTSSPVSLPLDHTFYYSNSNISDYENKPLPPPPKVHDPDSVPSPVVPGRKGFGIEGRATSPLRTKGLSRRPALRQSTRSPSDDTLSSAGGWRTPSVNSVESIWFSSPSTTTSGSVPRSVPRITKTEYDSDTASTSGCESILDCAESGFSAWGSTNTFSTAPSNRLRIFQYPLGGNDNMAEEVFVGPVFEVINYIWDTISHNSNISTLIETFSSFAVERGGVIDIVASNAIPMSEFLRTTELIVYIGSHSKPRYNTLDTLEIQLSPALISALVNPTNDSQITTIKALVRIAIIYQIGEYIHNHILIHSPGDEVLISPSINLQRSKTSQGGNIAVVGFLGGRVSYRWRGGRCEVLLRREGVVRRVPKGVVEEMWRTVRVGKFNVEELDL